VVRDLDARGPIYREVEVTPAHHEYHDEDVIIVRATFEVPGLTQHQPIPLSIDAATRLRDQLDEVLASTDVENAPSYPELVAFVAAVASADFLKPGPDKSWERKTADLIVRAKELAG
jgi:hypothetical protein